MSKDYYKILGVEKNASEDEIKKTFRRLAHEHHPDKGGDQQKFKDINEAYQILGDKQKRAKYDQFGSAAFENNGYNPNAGGFGGFDFNQGGFNVNMEDFGDLGDILGGMFGFGGGGRGRKRGRDLEMEVQLSFEEAVFGLDKEIRLFANSKCGTCQGSGADKDSKEITCSTCGGKGKVQQTQRTFLGAINTVVACPDCKGLGKKIEHPCSKCGGTGIEKSEKTLKVSIPAGMSSGEAIKLSRAGDYGGAGGVLGDLYLRIVVRSHKIFSRQGQDILSSVELPFSLLALGGKTEILTVDGEVTLKIPAGTKAGTVFKLRDKGVPYGGGYSRGDHLVTVMPAVPDKMSKEQKKALEEFKDIGL